MAVDGGPVIASSDRFAAILPYCKILHQEDHHRWGAIMPWNFPQHAGKEVEETFLLKEFSERECHMQGFRFLKQVWMSIAINNFELRIPFIVNGWFEQKGPEYLHDPSFKVHLLNENARAQTFFEQAEIELYGAAFLDTAVKCIQNEICRLQQYAESPVEKPVAAPLASVSVDDPDAVPVASPSTTGSPPLQPIENTKTTPLSTSTVLKPTATVFSSSNTPAQTTATVFEPSFDTRSFSDEVDRSQQRHKHGRKRGSTVKHYSFTDRVGYQPAQGFNDTRQPLHKMQQNHPLRQPQAPSAAMGPLPQFATRGPNTFSLTSPAPQYSFPFAPGQALPPPTYSLSQAPPGFENLHPRNLRNNGPVAFAAGPPPHPFGNPLLSERNMNQSDARHYGSQPDRSFYDHGPEQSRKRGDSNASYGVGGRGRGGRARKDVNRSSIDGEYRSGHRHPSGGYSDRSAFAEYHDDRQANAAQRPFEGRGTWRPQKHDENIGPIRHHFDQFPHGPPQILHNPRRAPQAPGPPSAEHQHPAKTTLSLPTHGHRLVSNPDNLSGYADDHCVVPQEDYGCSRTAIGEKCTYANKVIAFNIPADVPEITIRQCFERFGPVNHIAETRSTRTDGRKAYPIKFITFAEVQCARECVRQRRVTIQDKPIIVEVAREFWDSDHHLFKPRTATGMAYKDFPTTAPPSMHYIQNSAIAGVPQPARNTTRHHGEMPGDMSAVAPAPAAYQVSADTTSTVSGPGTPKGKAKKSGKKNKKTYREGSVSQATKDDAQQSRSPITPSPGDTSSVTTVEPKHTTLAKRESYLETEELERPAASIYGFCADDDRASEPQIFSGSPTETGWSTVAAASPSLAQVQSQTVAEATATAPNSDSKSEEEPLDNSLRTATVTPSEDSNMASIFAATPEATDGASNISMKHVQDDTTAPEVDVSAAATEAKSEVAEVSVGMDDKEELPSTLPKSKSKVSIALPDIDTSRSQAGSAEQSSEAQSSDRQRTISGSSEAAVAFVTAPNTPGSPETGQTCMSDVQFKKEAKSSEDSKTKGPAQTESLSLFGKTKKSKKSKVTKANSRATSHAGSVELPKPDGLLPRKATNPSKPAQNVKQNERVENIADILAAKSVALETNEIDDVAGIGSSTRDEGNEKKDSATQSSSLTDGGSDITDKSTRSTVQSPVRGGILRRLTGIFSSNPDRSVVVETAGASGVDITSEPANEDSSNNTDKDQEPVVITEPVRGDTPEANAETPSSSSKKNKKKKKSKKKAATGDVSDAPIANSDQPKAMVLEMGNLAPSNEVSAPLYEFHGTDFEGTDNTSAVAASKQDSDQSQPAKVKPPRRLISDRHLVQAPPMRRIHPRVKHKKSSDSSDSREESTLSTGQDQQKSVSTRDEALTAEQNNGQKQKLYLVFTTLDPVEQSRRKMERLEEHEKEFRQQKEKMGKILGEVVADGEEKVAKIVEPME